MKIYLAFLFILILFSCRGMETRSSIKVKSIWSFKAKGNVVEAPICCNGILYFGSKDSNVYAVNGKNGKLIWKYKTTGKVESNPLFLNDTLYIGNDNGTFYAFNAKNGQPFWKYKIGKYIVAKPIVYKNALIVGGCDSFLYSFERTNGMTNWETKMYGQIVLPLELFNKNIVVVADPTISRVDPDKGTILKAVKIASIHDFPILNARIYKGALYLVYYDHVEGLSLEDNSTVFIAEPKGDILREQLLFFDTMTIVNKFRKGIAAYNYKDWVDRSWLSTTEKEWAFKSNTIIMTLGVFDKKIYAGGRDSILYGIDPLNGKEIMHYKLASDVISSVYSDGVIYLGCADSCIHAIKVE